MNYAQLAAAIPAWVNNDSTELAAQIDTIIQLAENRIVRESDLRAFRYHATALTSPNDPYLSLPSGVIQVRYLRYRDGAFLDIRPESFISEYNDDPANTGTPKYYAQWDANTLVLAPTPNAAIEVELSYKKKSDSIVSAGTSWLGTNAEDTLLYACVLEAGIFLQATTDQLAVYQQRYKDALTALQSQEQLNAADEYLIRQTI